VRSRTSAVMVSRSAQSFTSSWSRPQNNSSIPCGLVISTKVQQHSKNAAFLYTQLNSKQMQKNCSETQLLPHSSNSWKINVVRIIHRTWTEHPQLLVLEAQCWMEQWWSFAHP
jgi:hypothetical protein